MEVPAPDAPPSSFNPNQTFSLFAFPAEDNFAGVKYPLSWIDAVQKQQLPWTCVFDPRGTAGIAAMSYNVQSVPTNVLIDRSGRIAGKNLYGERLSSKISELAK